MSALRVWLEEFGADLPSSTRSSGYHLEQAVRYQQELGQPDNLVLADKARQRLFSAGRRAHMRGDFSAARNLLGRADDLPGQPNVGLQKTLLIATLFGGDGRRALAIAEAHVKRAQDRDDWALELCSLMDLEFIRTFIKPTGALERLRSVTATAAELFEATNNLSGMYIVYQSRLQMANMQCDVAAVMTNLEAVVDTAHRIGIDNQFIAPLANWRILSASPIASP